MAGFDINYNDTLEEFRGDDIDVSVPYGVKRIGADAFAYFDKIERITLPNTVTAIDSFAFVGCKSLTSINIPDGVTEIGNRAFSSCKSLTSITIPKSVTKIGDFAFSNCAGAGSIVIPDTVTEIGDGAFGGCPCLADENGFIIIRGVLHGYVGDAEEIRVPDGVRRISAYAFSGRENIRSITVPESVTEIGDHAFYGCPALVDLTLPESVTELADYLFSECSALTSVTIPASVTKIAGGAFYGCSSLSSIMLPDGITEISDKTFRECTSLASIKIPDTVTLIGNHAFDTCSSLESITLPDGVRKIGYNAFFKCTALREVTLPEGLTEVDCCTFDGCTSLESITLPESLTVVDYNMFRDCTSLTQVNLPKTLSRIRNYAFMGCTSLESITLPDGVTELGDYAFCGCKKLSDINVPDSVTKIGACTFADCPYINADGTIASQPKETDADAKEEDVEPKKEYTAEELQDLWQKASDLFDEDNAAGFAAWLELSELGYARSSHSVGWCYRFGYGVEKDIKKAKYYYALAVKGGYDRSNAALFSIMVEEEENYEAGITFLIKGANGGSSECFSTLATECYLGNIFGGNPRVTAYLAARAWELDKANGVMLGALYLEGKFFPQVYPYAKYCIEGAQGFSKESLEENGFEFPKCWDEIEPIEPKYPDFGLTLDTCADAVDPTPLMEKARELMFCDEPDDAAAAPLVLEAAKAGHSGAMYYTFLLDLDGWNDYVIDGADEYGNMDCIEVLASIFTEHLPNMPGKECAQQAAKYWYLRKKLHGCVPMSPDVENLFEDYCNFVFSKSSAEKPRRNTERNIDPDANAILLRTDGSLEPITVDFTTLEGLYAPINCSRLNIISTQKLRTLSDRLGFTVVMYCDERGMMKNLKENSKAAYLSGYDVIFGDVVICGFDRDYAPLETDEIADVLDELDAQ